MSTSTSDYQWDELASIPADFASLLGDASNGKRNLVPRPESREVVVVPPARDLPVEGDLVSSVLSVSDEGVVRTLPSPFDLRDLAHHYQMAILRSKASFRPSPAALERPVEAKYYPSTRYGGVLVTPAPGMTGPVAWSVFSQVEWATTLSGSGIIPGAGGSGEPQFVSDLSGQYLAITVRPEHNSRRLLQVQIEQADGFSSQTIAKIEGYRIAWFADARLHFLQHEGMTVRNWRHGSIPIERLVSIARSSSHPFTSSQYQKELKSGFDLDKSRLPTDIFSFDPTINNARSIPISNLGVLFLTKRNQRLLFALVTNEGELLSTSFDEIDDAASWQLLSVEQDSSGDTILSAIITGRHGVEFCVLRLSKGCLTGLFLPVVLTESMRRRETRMAWSYGAVSTESIPLLIAHSGTKLWAWRADL